MTNAACSFMRASVSSSAAETLQSGFSSCRRGAVANPRDVPASTSESLRKKLTPRSAFSVVFGSKTLIANPKKNLING